MVNTSNVTCDINSVCFIWSQCNHSLIRGAAIAQWIRLRLPFCRPRFESQAYHLSFYKKTYSMIRYVFKFCSWRGSIKRFWLFINRLLKSKNCCKKRVDKFEQKWRRYLHRTVCIYLLSSNKPFFMHLPTYDACLSAFMSECCQIGSSDWMSCHFSSNKAKIKMSQQIMVLKRLQW